MGPNSACHRTVALPIAMLAVGLALATGCAKPPQLGSDEKVLSAADALLTAVSSHDSKLLDQCAANLAKVCESGDLPQPAYDYLQRIIAEARDGHWRAARERLVKLVKAQRRTA